MLATNENAARIAIRFCCLSVRTRIIAAAFDGVGDFSPILLLPLASKELLFDNMMRDDELRDRFRINR